MSQILLARLQTGLLAEVRAALGNGRHHLHVAQEHDSLVMLAPRLRPDLTILEVRPGRDDLEVCREWRQRGLSTPVLIVSALGQESDKVRGLNAGADAYVTQPLCMRELQVRVRAMLRGARMRQVTPRRLVSGSLSLDPAGRSVQVGGHEIPFTPHEFSLLEALMSAPGVAFCRQDLMDLAWGKDYISDERLVDTYVRNLRAKLGPCSRHILTVRGVGYKFAD